MKKTINILLLICFFIFIVSAIVNLEGSQDAHMLSLLSADESIQYPYLIHMLSGGSSLFETLKNFVAYQHYFYGYPFYLFSAVSILPVRLITGAAFAEQVQLNLFLLRQVVSVLPMLLAVMLLVYLQTGFQNPLKSVFLFLILATIPAVTRNNLWFWHPDALALLGIVAAIFFLNKDQFRFGKFFTYAAIACGLSAGIKVIGAFFFLAVLVYLGMGMKSRSLPFRIIAKKAAIFLLVFLLIFLLTNPLLLISQTRTQILKIQAQQNSFVREGWTDEDVYQTGLSAWLPYFEEWYANTFILLFFLASVLYGILRGKQRLMNSLLLAWLLPYSIYLIFFVAVKPFHYPLPVMIPLFSAALNFFPDTPKTEGYPTHAPIRIAIGGLLVFLLITNSLSSWKVYQEYYEKEDLLLACNSEPENSMDGSTVTVPAGHWYRIEEFDLRSAQKSHSFSVTQGPVQVSATEENGSQVWACRNEKSAYFSASRLAEYFKKSHPAYTVIGPSGQEIE
ncbi:MAG: hypothetical protein ACYC59_12280 [Anaerolineaceae bacterium]